jgi:hypothetical protein
MKYKWVLAIIAGLFIIQFFSYYQGYYQPPSTESYRIEEIEAPMVQPEAFTDKYELGNGTVVFYHVNSSYTIQEITPLITRLTSRGFYSEFLDDRNLLAEKLKYTDSLVIILPGTPFDSEEAEEIQKFLDKGGRLLLISDPQRPSSINSLSTYFGIIFEEGYLYNMKVNDGNFRNIYLEEFADTNVTHGLKKVVFYSSCPIDSQNGVIFGDENTFSSRSEVRKQYSPAALVGNILALCDLTFMLEPYDNIEDNPQLISNIADFLTHAKRSFLLEDFPYFFRDEVDIYYTESKLFKYAFEIKEILGKKSRIISKETNKDMVILGLYDSFVEVSKYLEEENITITSQEISIGEAGKIKRKDTSLIYLNQDDRRNVLVILADSEEKMENTLRALKNGTIQKYLLNRKTAILL